MTRQRESESHQTRPKACCDAADINDKLIICLRELGHIMRFQCGGKASQQRILIILHEVGGITQRALTQRLGIQPGSASEVIAKLENAGLISRAPNAVDRRTADIRLTEAGRALALEALEKQQKRHEDMFSCLSGEEKQTMLGLLEKLCTDWDTRFCDGGSQ